MCFLCFCLSACYLCYRRETANPTGAPMAAAGGALPHGGGGLGVQLRRWGNLGADRRNSTAAGCARPDPRAKCIMHPCPQHATTQPVGQGLSRLDHDPTSAPARPTDIAVFEIFGACRSVSVGPLQNLQGLQTQGMTSPPPQKLKSPEPARDAKSPTPRDVKSPSRAKSTASSKVSSPEPCKTPCRNVMSPGPEVMYDQSRRSGSDCGFYRIRFLW